MKDVIGGTDRVGHDSGYGSPVARYVSSLSVHNRTGCYWTLLLCYMEERHRGLKILEKASQD